MDLHLSDQDPACPIPPSAVHVWVQETASRQENWSATPNILEVQVGTTTSGGGNDIRHARHFKLHLGRFLSTDPIGGAIGSSQSWNRYSYVNGNPVRLVGPMGLAGEDINGKAGGCDEDSVAGDKACFKGEIVVTATALPLFSDGHSVSSGWSQQQAQMYILGMMYNDWLDSQRSMKISGAVDGGIMARLSQQPRVPTGMDVLRETAALCNQSSSQLYQEFSDELFGGLQSEADLQLQRLHLSFLDSFAAGGAKFGISFTLGKVVSTQMGKPTPLSFLIGQFTGEGPVGLGRIVEAGSAAEVGGAAYAASKSFQLGLRIGIGLRVLGTPCR